MNLKQMITALPARRTAGLDNEKLLITPWGEKLLEGNEIPLTEYPRPQLVREAPCGRYISLNGKWDYAIMGDRRLPEAWDGKILVPFSPESRLSGVERQLHPHEYLWYEKRFIMADVKENRRYLLHFGAVDQFCQIYLNGKRIEKHEGGYMPFSTEITYVLKEGENILRICVEDMSDSSYLTRGKQRINRGGMFYTAQSGIWQSVWLEEVPLQYIEYVKIKPELEEHMFDITVCVNGRHTFGKTGHSSNTREKMGITLHEPEIVSGKEFLKQVTRHIDPELEYTSIDHTRREYRTRVELSTIRLWTPQNPWLYGLTLTFEEDMIFTYSALRAVSIDVDKEGKKRIFLNHQPFFMNGVLSQGYYPESLMTAPSDEALLYDIKTAKELGFNMIRVHCKLESERFYYHCDTKGMLVWQDMVNGGASYSLLKLCYLPTILPYPFAKVNDKEKRVWRMTGRGRARSRRIWFEEMNETIHRLYNHPSIVCWVLFNEGWGQFDSSLMEERARKIDSTRLVDAASGWFDQGAGDFMSVHNYFRPLKVVQSERAFVISEFGGLAYREKDHVFSDKIYGYGLIKDKFALNRSFKDKMDKIKSLVPEGLSAAVYTQLTDIEEEINGLMTYDRRITKIRDKGESHEKTEDPEGNQIF